MNERELEALVQLLNRVAMSKAEQLWVQALITKLEAMMRDTKLAT
jgi:hypothetical protein